MNRITLPTLEELDTKIKDIKAALAYQFKEEDVEKVYKILQTSLNTKESNNNVFRLSVRKSVSKQIHIIMQ